MSINHQAGCPPGQALGNCLRKRALQQSGMRRAAPHAAVPWPVNPGHRQQASQHQASLCKHHQLRQPQVCAAASSSLAAASDPSPQRQKGSASNALPQQRQLDLHADASSTSGKEEEPERPDKSLFDRLVSPVISIMAACLRFLKRLLLPQKGLKRQAFGSLVMLIVGFLLIGRHAIGTGHMASSPQEVTYSRFVHMVHAGNVRAARIDDSADRVVFDIHTSATRKATTAAQEAGLAPAESSDPASAGAATETAAVVRSGMGRSPSQFYTRCIKDPNLIPLLVTAGVEFGALRVGLMDVVLKLLASTLVVWLPMIPLFYLMRRALDSKTGSAAKKKKTNKDVPVITFRDVAGVDSAKVELLEVVACLQDARRYAKLNAKMPSGVLLCGPPGTGKTLLAKAVAGEAGVPFFAASASEFVELFVGRGAARIRDLFAEARKRAPSVVFIDELDAVGGKRGLGLNEERDQTLNQLLTELDGFEGRQGVLLLAATNRAQVLDSALTRPGRLSRKVVVPLPDRQGREDILNVHLRPKPMISAAEKAEAAQVISRLTGGFSGAELANVVDEAACLAARQGAEVVQLKELVEAVSRTRFGISGGNAGIAPVQGLRKRFNDWLVELMSSSRRVQSSPMGQ